MSRDPDSPEGYDDVKSMAAKLRRAMKTLIALSGPNDPYLAGAPARMLAAAWFTDMWGRFDMKTGSHVRRLHYIMVSQETPITLPNSDEPYENTIACSQLLHRASADARFLGMIPNGLIIDRRNPEANIFLADESEVPADITVTTGYIFNPSLGEEKTVLGLPFIRLNPPTAVQRFHLEIWCEKSTMNDILLPIGERYGINVVTAAGEMSLTACELLVARARASGLPVRIFYISDFDPAGQSMPVAVARKIEFLVRSTDLDIQVRPVALTHEQCVAYRLPRTPIKETEGRGAKFESRFGEGGTELDALEALHPGVLRWMIETEIAKYYDRDLDHNIQQVVREAQRDINLINSEVRGRHLAGGSGARRGLHGIRRRDGALAARADPDAAIRNADARGFRGSVSLIGNVRKRTPFGG